MFFFVNIHPNKVLIEVLNTPELGATFSFFDLSHVTHKTPYLVAQLPKVLVDPEKWKDAFMTKS